VHVVDDNGKIVQGKPFMFRLKKDGKEIQKVYPDEDKDGMLYLADMESGEYEVKLSPLADFEVPKDGVAVSVSDEISYTVIDDISFLIRSEDEIDATVEDTAVNEAELDADGTETADVMDGHNGMVTEYITGTTPSIIAQADTRYICGEVATLDFTPSASGICDVVFTSGATATVLTVPSTIKWANGFDPTSLDANTTYEINIMDGLGVAVGWT
jgi:hypothetical protein